MFVRRTGGPPETAEIQSLWSPGRDEVPGEAELSRLAGEARKAVSADDKRLAKSRLLAAGAALGLLQQSPSDWFSRGSDSDDDARIQALIDERNGAKKSRDFARADAIRQQLAEEGVLIEDTPAGVRWRRG